MLTTLLRRVITWSVRHLRVVLALSALLTAAGLVAAFRTPVDAIPDLSDVQVVVMTEWPGQSPSLVEDQITYPLSSELLKVPRTRVVRGMSQFGLSAVYVVFEDGTDLYWARSRVLEYLNTVRERLPDGAMPILGPDATGVGWVMQYMLADTSGRRNLAELRALQDFTVKPALTGVTGVAEIATLGGFEQQYQIEVDPLRLAAYGVSMEDVVTAVRAANRDAGGRTLELGGTEYVVRGRGRVTTLDDLRAIGISRNATGTTVTVAEVATVTLGPELRRGIADLNGRGDVVTGFVVMRYGENPREVIARVKARMATLAPTLPVGVVFVAGYDRSGLIDGAVATLRTRLVEESIIVAAVTLLFLLHAQSALVAVVTLPIGILMALLAMRTLGLSANIMSLGGIAIAIGAMIDASVVMVENYHKHLERHLVAGGHEPVDAATRWRLVIASAEEVGPSLFVSLLVITVSFLPIFALEAQEGRLFHPLAWTKTLSMAAAALLSVTLVPVLMGLFIRRGVKAEAANPVNRTLVKVYGPVIDWVLRHRGLTLGIATAVLLVSLVPWTRLGSEFMPPLDEGSIMDMPSLAAGIGTEQAKAILRQRDAAIAAVPEVASVLGKVGRAETATDMAPMSMIESIVLLRPPSEWRDGVSRDSILAELDARVRTPGVANMWSMPIKNRLDMLATGIKTPVGIKIFGPDASVLDRIGREIEKTLPRVTGTGSVFAEQTVAGRYLDVEVDRAAVARYGLSVAAVEEAMSTAVGGAYAGEVLAGRERYSVLVRYPRAFRDASAAIERVQLDTPDGARIALADVARLRVVRGPTLIKSENAQLNNIVYVDVRDRDVGGYVAEARVLLQQNVVMPAGYRLEWSGQFEAMERASRRLRLVVPATLLVIFLLLYANFRSAAESALVMLSLPFALVGGVWMLWLLGYNQSVATTVGFVALAGVAAETGVIMLLYLDQAYEARRHAGQLRSQSDLDAAIHHGAVARVRPKMMTVTAIMAGLLPILWGGGTGSDVMRRIAAPMVGGMITSTILTLVVIPAIYSLWKGRPLANAETPVLHKERTDVQAPQFT